MNGWRRRAHSFGWLLLITLGTPVLPVTSTTQTVQTCALALCLTVVADSAFRGRNLAFPFVPAALLVLILVIQSLSASVNGYDVSSNIGTISIAISATAIFALHSPAANARAFAEAGIAALIAGWIASWAGLNNSGMSSNYEWSITSERFQGLLTAPNAAGLLAVLTCAALVGAKLPPWWLLIPLASMTASEYRGGLVAMYALTLLVIARHSFVSGRWWTMALALPVSVFLPRLFLSRNGGTDSTTGRTSIWDYCEAVINGSGPLGNGPNTLMRRLTFDNSTSLAPAHCHNQFLDDWLNFGLLAAILTALLIFSLASVGVAKGIPSNTAIAAVVFVVSLTEAPLRLWAGQRHIWPLVLVWSLSLASIQPQARERASAQQLTGDLVGQPAEDL